MGALHRVTIVGGGYSGCTAAIQLVRASHTPLAITIVEPRAEVGYGMAYSSADPDHRLNGLPDNHMVDPRDPGALQRWYEESGRVALDLEARTADAGLFIRRRDFGRFVSDAVAAHPQIRHERDRAVGARLGADSISVITQKGNTLESKLVVVATGHAPPRLPAAVASLAGVPGVIADPADLDAVRSIQSEARVLVLGNGLTALDLLSTLVRSGHRGPISVLSRRGLRPRPQRPRVEPLPGAPTLLERIDGPVAPFLLAAGSPPPVRALLRAIRARIREVEAEGLTWHAAFDDLRDVVWKVWPGIAVAEKRRFHRLLRSWYDAHRFRAPPQNDALVRVAEARGRIVFLAGRVASAAATRTGIQVELVERGSLRKSSRMFDALINCTGSDAAAGVDDNPFLAALLSAGLASRDPSGMGLATAVDYRAIRPDGSASERLRVIGPPSAGTFGDPFGAVFIAAHVRRMLPGALALLAR